MQQDQKFSTLFKLFFLTVIVFKLVLICLFSSGYQDDLFIPFVLNYLEHGGNPWAAEGIPPEAFPYPPLMLYILSAFLYPVQHLQPPSIWLNLFYGLPLLLADLLITAILIRLFIWNKKEVFIFYFISPIILFASYMHGQLDILPTAMLFTAIYLLTKRYYLFAAIAAGLAISTKFHTVAALPLIVIYLFSKGKYKEIAYMLAIPFFIYMGFSYAYLFDDGSYSQLVMQNQKQEMIFNSYFFIGQVKIYLPILLAALFYLRFAAYPKINNDLLFAATGALFSIFLLVVEPSPGWFIWVSPYLTIFFIRYFYGLQHYLLYSALVCLYLIYYLIFNSYDHEKLLFLGNTVLKYNAVFNLPLGDILYTLLDAVIIGTIYLFYKNGIKSNEVYTMEDAFVLGIGGDSGAGKTTLIGYIRAIFGDQLLQLEGDGDHKWERGDNNWQDYTHLDPKANLLHRQAEQVSRLKSRKNVKRSDYNHETGKFTEADTIKSKDFIVLAGLHPFYLPKMRKVIDLKIFLDLDERLRKSWKIERDQKQRGYSQEQVLEFLEKREPDSQKYIRPQKQFSDLNIHFFPADETKFDGHIYNGRLGLAFEMNANIPLDRVIQSFKDHGCSISWDYSEDLKTQFIRFEEEPKSLDIHWYVENYITNYTELAENPQWKSGYAGIIQFLIFFAICETKQDRVFKHV